MLAIVLLAAAAMAAEPPTPPASPNPAAAPSLLETISALDAAAFDAFNHCDEPGQLDRHAGFFADNVEFFHDTGGVTWNRADMLANTRKYVCGHFTRELVPGTLVVYPIKGFGAIEQGTHRFCQRDSGQCEGLAEFTIVWHDTGTSWEITRVLSYGHRAAAAAP